MTLAVPFPDDPEAARTVLADALAADPRPWTGPLLAVVDRLRQTGRADVALGRLVEGHADACRILDQAGRRPEPGVYGVWASRSAGTGLVATPRDGGWRVTGEMRFASGVDLIDHALVTARLDSGDHLLLELPAKSVATVPGSWTTGAMAATRSFTVTVDESLGPEQVVGPRNFYLDRPGFLVGGLGPAAVWAGGARGIVDRVAEASAAFDLTGHQHRRLGQMEQAVWSAVAALRSAAGQVDAAPDAPTEVLGDLAARARTAVVLACDEVLAQAPLVVGPGGLVRIPGLATTLHDLALYIRQHHLDPVLEQLGRATAAPRGGR